MDIKILKEFIVLCKVLDVEPTAKGLKFYKVLKCKSN